MQNLRQNTRQRSGQDTGQDTGHNPGRNSGLSTHQRRIQADSRRFFSLRSACSCLLALACWLPSGYAEADSFRCGRKVVRSGDAQAQLLSACGEPQRRDSGQEELWTGASQKTVKVQRWYYKTSGRKLERVVVLYQGKIVAVQTGGR